MPCAKSVCMRNTIWHRGINLSECKLESHGVWFSFSPSFDLSVCLLIYVADMCAHVFAIHTQVVSKTFLKINCDKWMNLYGKVHVKCKHTTKKKNTNNAICLLECLKFYSHLFLLFLVYLLIEFIVLYWVWFILIWRLIYYCFSFALFYFSFSSFSFLSHILKI